MANPLSPESRALLKMLADGEWHSFEDVITRLAITVAPGKALRRYERRRKYWEQSNGARVSPELSDDEKIASGQRTEAGVALYNMRQRHLEQIETDDGRKVRLRPDARAAKPETPTSTTAEDVEGVQEPTQTVQSAPAPNMCELCGLWVANHVQHELYHSERGTIRSVEEPAAFFTESQVRRIIREELDAFQTGLSGFLSERFADLERTLSVREYRPNKW